MRSPVSVDLRLRVRRLADHAARGVRGFLEWLRERLPRFHRTRRVLKVAGYAVLVLVVVTVMVVLPWRWVDPPVSSYMAQDVVSGLKEHGVEGVHLRHQWVALEEISPRLWLAAVAAEDQRFLEHRGVDLEAIRQALGDALQGKRLRGASTISQQTAKNLFLWHGRSYVRKILEVWLAASMEILWPKERILEVYLNIAEWGEHLFGAEAAARVYFGVSAGQLDSHQAALMAAALPNPHRLRIEAPDERLRQRQQWVLAQMQALGGNHLEPLEVRVGE